MARHKGAVGFEIGTSKLGAYSMEDTLEIFEKEGYVKYKDLDQYFKDCYFDFENKLSEKEFIEKSKKNILKSSKYKQFINNEVKMCSICGRIKPLGSYKKRDDCSFGVNYMCRICENSYSREYRKTEKGKEIKRKSSQKYNANNKDKVNKAKLEYQKNNKGKIRKWERRLRMKNYLKSRGIIVDNPAILDNLVQLKNENNIRRYDDLLKQFGSVLNG